MYHATVQKILALLNTNGVWYETFEHAPVRTSTDAAKIRHGYTLHQGAKSLIVRVKIPHVGKKFVMLVIPGDTKFDSGKVRFALGASEIRFATEEEVSEVTQGVQVGGVPPFGNIFGLEVFVDPHIVEQEKIIFNAGDRQFSVAMKATDYQKLVKPKILGLV